MACTATRRGAYPGDLPQQRSDRSPPTTIIVVLYKVFPLADELCTIILYWSTKVQLYKQRVLVRGLCTSGRYRTIRMVAYCTWVIMELCTSCSQALYIAGAGVLGGAFGSYGGFSRYPSFSSSFMDASVRNTRGAARTKNKGRYGETCYRAFFCEKSIKQQSSGASKLVQTPEGVRFTAKVRVGVPYVNRVLSGVF